MSCKYLLFFFSVIFILVVSLVPVPEVKVSGNTDKLVHFMMYFANMGFFWFAFREKMGNTLVSGVIFSTSFGAFVEVLQYFTPYRSFSLADILANFIGAACAGILLYYRQRNCLSKPAVSFGKTE